MRFAKMRKFVLIVSRFSPAFAGAIKSAIGARKGKFKIPNIGSRRQRTPGTKPARAARFKNGNFFRPLAEFFNFPKNGIDAHLSLFLSFISHAELLAPHPRPAKSRADFLWAAQGVLAQSPGRTNHDSAFPDGSTHSARLDANHTLRMLRLQPRITPARCAFSTLQTALFQ